MSDTATGFEFETDPGPTDRDYQNWNEHNDHQDNNGDGDEEPDPGLDLDQPITTPDEEETAVRVEIRRRDGDRPEVLYARGYTIRRNGFLDQLCLAEVLHPVRCIERRIRLGTSVTDLIVSSVPLDTVPDLPPTPDAFDPDRAWAARVEIRRRDHAGAVAGVEVHWAVAARHDMLGDWVNLAFPFYPLVGETRDIQTSRGVDVTISRHPLAELDSELHDVARDQFARAHRDGATC